MKSTMSLRLKTSFFCYMLILPQAITFSLIYLFRSEFMPFHASIVEQNWSEVDPAFQILILALMKVAGGGWLSIVIAVSILLFGPFRKGKRWAYWAVPAVALPPMLIILYLQINVSLNTQSSPPWVFSVLGLILLLAGFILSMVPETKVNSAEQV